MQFGSFYLFICLNFLIPGSGRWPRRTVLAGRRKQRLLELCPGLRRRPPPRLGRQLSLPSFLDSDDVVFFGRRRRRRRSLLQRHLGRWLVVVEEGHYARRDGRRCPRWRVSWRAMWSGVRGRRGRRKLRAGGPVVWSF